MTCTGTSSATRIEHRANDRTADSQTQGCDSGTAYRSGIFKGIGAFRASVIQRTFPHADDCIYY